MRGKKTPAPAVAGSMRVATLVVLTLAACEKKPAPPLEQPQQAAPSAPPVASVKAAEPKAEKVEVPEVHVRAGAPTTVRVTWVTPKGTAVNDDAPFRVQWNRSDGLTDAPADVKSTGADVKSGFRVQVQPMVNAPNATLGGEISIVVCDDTNHAVCVPVKRSVELGFVVSKGAPDEATVAIPLPAARLN